MEHATGPVLSRPTSHKRGHRQNKSKQLPFYHLLLSFYLPFCSIIRLYYVSADLQLPLRLSLHLAVPGPVVPLKPPALLAADRLTMQSITVDNEATDECMPPAGMQNQQANNAAMLVFIYETIRPSHEF